MTDGLLGFLATRLGEPQIGHHPENLRIAGIDGPGLIQQGLASHLGSIFEAEISHV